MTIQFGPAGLGPIKTAIGTLEKYHESGLKACEISFTRNIYIKDKSVALSIGKKAKALGIDLSIHAPYFINLNSKESEKIEASKKRILRCMEVGNWLGAKRVVFHAGFYSDIDREESYQNIKDAIIDIMKTGREEKYSPKLAPEVMGKINVFGSIEEIARLVRDTQCHACIDFAHILARYKKYEFALTKKEFKELKKWHIHFSGIEYGEKGERRHLKTKEEEWTKLLKNIPKNKDIVIINESPSPFEDSILGKEIYEKLSKK